MDLFNKDAWAKIQAERIRTSDSGIPNQEKVRILRLSDPNLRAVEISRIVGISRERVRQILVTLDLETDIRPRLLEERKKVHRCKFCGLGLADLNRKYCSKACFYRLHGSKWLYFSCENCGETVSVRESMQKIRISRGAKRTFCSRKCFQDWVHNNPGSIRSKSK